jgi:hypothetical protein
MRRIVMRAAAGWAAATLLALAAQSASANQLSLTSRGYTAAWSSLQMTAPGIATIRCPLTLEGSFHSSTLRKVTRALVGYVSRATIVSGVCTGGTASAMRETLPWHVQYDAFSGTLPAITGVTLRVIRLSAQATAAGLTCPYASTEAAPARVIATVGSGIVTGLRFDEASRVPPAPGAPFLCTFGGSSVLAGTGRFTALGSTASVGLTLIGAPPPPPPIVITVGDSYIAGEAGRWAGNTGEPAAWEIIDALGNSAYWDEPGTSSEKIALCHRSQVWEGGISGFEPVTTLNLGCTSARRETFTEPTGPFKPGLDLYNVPPNKGQARMLQEYAAAHTSEIRMVVVSIGGNDMGFGRLLRNCVTAFSTFGNCKDETAGRQTIEANNIAATVIAATAAIRDVHEAMANAGYTEARYKLLVQDYPSPLPPSALLREYTNQQRAEIAGCPIRTADLDWIDQTVLPLLNGAVWSAVETTGYTNALRLELRSVLNGRRLCERGVDLLENYGPRWDVGSGAAIDHVEWVNRIRYFTELPLYVQEGLHPNYWGQKALRRCVRLAYNHGAPTGGTCTLERPGHDFENWEPYMRLTP